MTPPHDLISILIHLDLWLDSLRLPGGYAGPVVHWWDDCLEFTGPALDWRYEGIIAGYLSLWRAHRVSAWLEKACRAADDLLAGQLPSGNFRNSCFELNPNTAGTPHEAAADLGLLLLAAELKSLPDPRWLPYFQAAQRNLTGFYLERLWYPALRSFRDDPALPSFVPNKSATLVEALLLYARLSGSPEIVERYALPTLDALLAHQLSTGPLAGAVCQNSIGNRKIAAFFPYYNARCIPGLLAGYQVSADPRYREAALSIARWLLRQRYPDGSFPQVVYPRQRLNRYPQWIAPLGDLLRALDLLLPYGFEYDPRPTLDWLLAGRLPNGAFRTALGFGRLRFFGPPRDPRDDVACAGWVDKTFRYLAARHEQESLALSGVAHA